MNQSKFNTDALHLTYITNETISEENEDYYPVFYNAFFRSTQSVEAEQNTLQHTDQNVSFASMMNSLFTFLLSVVGSRRIFFFR